MSFRERPEAFPCISKRLKAELLEGNFGGFTWHFKVLKSVSGDFKRGNRGFMDFRKSFKSFTGDFQKRSMRFKVF